MFKVSEQAFLLLVLTGLFPDFLLPFIGNIRIADDIFDSLDRRQVYHGRLSVFFYEKLSNTFFDVFADFIRVFLAVRADFIEIFFESFESILLYCERVSSQTDVFGKFHNFSVLMLSIDCTSLLHAASNSLSCARPFSVII